MQIIKKVLPASDSPVNSIGDFSLSDCLLFDIETTGLSPAHSFVYLIGWLTVDENGDRRLCQLLADSDREEKDLLETFFEETKGKKVLMHYNGDRFDIPFLVKRSFENGVSCPLKEMSSIDLMKEISPFRDLLGLFDLKQQTVEAFFLTGRQESRSGGELIAVYKDYTETGSDSLKAPLLSHNEADVLGLYDLLPLLNYRQIFDAPISIDKAEAKEYVGYDSDKSQELLMSFHLDEPVPKPVFGSFDNCYFRLEGTDGIIKVPIYSGELKYFYANYKEYWYFPGEDMALHRSVASFAERSHREPATARNCYTRKRGSFLPQWNEFLKPFFKTSYDSRSLYFELTEERKADRAFFNSYASYVLKHILAR